MSKVKIEYRFDNTCDMEALYVNGECIGEGNAWDNHLRHGAETLLAALNVLKIPAVLKVNPYRYEE